MGCRSAPGGPVLDPEAGHREVLAVAGGEARSHADRGGVDQAVGLRQRYPACREVASPPRRPLAIEASERRDPKAVEEPRYRRPLAASLPGWLSWRDSRAGSDGQSAWRVTGRFAAPASSGRRRASCRAPGGRTPDPEPPRACPATGRRRAPADRRERPPTSRPKPCRARASVAARASPSPSHRPGPPAPSPQDAERGRREIAPGPRPGRGLRWPREHPLRPRTGRTRRPRVRRMRSVAAGDPTPPLPGASFGGRASIPFALAPARPADPDSAGCGAWAPEIGPGPQPTAADGGSPGPPAPPQPSLRAPGG